jgi:hypothetical protein
VRSQGVPSIARATMLAAVKYLDRRRNIGAGRFR